MDGNEKLVIDAEFFTEIRERINDLDKRLVALEYKVHNDVSIGHKLGYYRVWDSNKRPNNFTVRYWNGATWMQNHLQHCELNPVRKWEYWEHKEFIEPDETFPYCGKGRD